MSNLRRICRSLGLGKDECELATLPSHYCKFISEVRDGFAVCSRLDDFLSTLDGLPFALVLFLCKRHNVEIAMEKIKSPQFKDIIRSKLVTHLVTSQCALQPIRNSAGEFTTCVPQQADRVQRMELLLPLVVDRKGLSKSTMMRILSSLDIEVDVDKPTPKDLRTFAKRALKDLKRGKVNDMSRMRIQRQRDELHASLEDHLHNVRTQWPTCLSDEAKRSIVQSFQEATSTAALAHTCCAVCSESKISNDMLQETIQVNSRNLAPIRKRYPTHLTNPFLEHPILRDYIIDPSGVVSDSLVDPRIRICTSCYNIVCKRKKLPRMALANGFLLGPIPQCLRDLTIVEEAMVARRRGKACIIQLNSNDHSSPTAQRGLKGHIIIYPTDPDKLCQVLPAPITEVSTPICALLIGSQEPTADWLMKNAKPLVVRREKVRNALLWLKEHNPLYKDVKIDLTSLNSMEETSIAPVKIVVQNPTDATLAAGSSYDPVQNNDPTPESVEAIFNTAVISDVEGGDVTMKQMTALALRHLRSGGGYLQVPHAAEPSNTYTDYDLFPSLYPSLFPYGIGGFEHPNQPLRTSMKAAVEHMLNMNDTRFQTHQSFLFVVFNILQRRAVSHSARLKMKQKDFTQFAEQLSTLSDDAIQRVADRYGKGDTSSAYDEEEKLVLKLMREVKLINSKVQGTAAARLAMRNEIRGMIMQLGTPSFYITINPADIYSPILKFLAGEEIDLDNILPEAVPKFWDQAVLVAKNPCLTAKFFHLIMEAFFETIIGYNVKKDVRDTGVLGLPKGYYGCVEAQGRGSLHCHMLIWLEGALNPQEIRERVNDTGFRDRLCAYIDDTIFTSVPHPSQPTAENEPHPCSTRGPLMQELQSLSDDPRSQDDLHRLVYSCQRHVHTATCYKYGNADNGPQQCRFDLDESHHVERTTMNNMTGELEFRITDGMVNNFCDTILRAIRCNMDIKFIGSGQSAKAVIYYITDYITKSQLKTHVAYATLQAAVEKLKQAEQQSEPTTDDFENRARILLVKCANSLIAKQELSGPQVASYLLGFGDHYTSHLFKSLYWTSFEGYINTLETRPTLNSNSDGNVTVDVDNGSQDFDDVLLEPDASGSIRPRASQVIDYIYRGAQFESYSVWDCVRKLDKISHTDSNSEANEVNAPSRTRKKGRKLHKRSEFMNEHPECETHILRERQESKQYIVVPIGPAIPRRDREEVKEKYAKTMLLLFKPWRTLTDLKGESLSWSDAFENFSVSADKATLRVIDNIQVLHECRDSRDDHFEQRRSVRKSFMRSMDKERALQFADDDIDDVQADVSEDVILNFFAEADDAFSDRNTRLDEEVDDAVTSARSAGMFNVSESTEQTRTLGHMWPVPIDITNEPTESPSKEATWKKTYEQRRAQYKKDLQDYQTSDDAGVIPPKANVPATDEGVEIEPSITSVSKARRAFGNGTLDGETLVNESLTSDEANEALIKDICSTFTLNSEQERAFRIIAEHAVRQSDADPIRMFLGGAGGTGKSRVIDAYRDLFSKLGQSRRFRTAAFTGSAALNVKGMTIHALLHLQTNDKGTNSLSNSAKQALVKMWEGVDFLFIDEVSMIGCEFLTSISDNLQKAKENNLPFGGISVVFAGDFCQLPPIRGTRLYKQSRTPFKKRAPRTANETQTPPGQRKGFGQFLWAGLNQCVLLEKQMRQDGGENARFRELLGRLRKGACNKADIALLKTRVLCNTDVDFRQAEWRDAPIITVHNPVKDALNREGAKWFSEATGQEYHEYCAIDTRGGKRVPTAIRDYLRKLPTNKAGKLLAHLPLVPGMKVVFTHNYDVQGGIVNGTEGILRSIRYETNSYGEREAKSCVVAVKDIMCDNLPFLHDKEVVALQEESDYQIEHPYSHKKITFKRRQLPIMPAFAMTDYKSQGKTLEKVILDLRNCRGFQSPYVMISRAKTLEGILILQDFDGSKLCCAPPEDLRKEHRRLHMLSIPPELRNCQTKRTEKHDCMSETESDATENSNGLYGSDEEEIDTRMSESEVECTTAMYQSYETRTRSKSPCSRTRSSNNDLLFLSDTEHENQMDVDTPKIQSVAFDSLQRRHNGILLNNSNSDHVVPRVPDKKRKDTHERVSNDRHCKRHRKGDITSKRRLPSP